MSERLRHLQRQQALLREHLAWIEAEIAREAPVTESSPTPHPPSDGVSPVVAGVPALAVALSAFPTSTPLTASSSVARAATADADSLIERYAATERQNPADIRRGCFIVFFAALLLVAVGVAAVWLIFYR